MSLDREGVLAGVCELELVLLPVDVLLGVLVGEGVGETVAVKVAVQNGVRL
jgi:hypothetical protein